MFVTINSGFFLRSVRVMEKLEVIIDDLVSGSKNKVCRFIRSWTQRCTRNARHFLLSAAGVSVYNWNTERISDEEINRYRREIEEIERLRKSTIICPECNLRIKFDEKQPNVTYCESHGAPIIENEGWQPFMDRKDMLVWRKKEPNDLYTYKIYGSFPDVTAEDFLQVQIDIDYRKKWDTNACVVQLIESDPISVSCKDQSTDIIYWEIKWPVMFLNRDYVYQRRWVIDRENGLIILISKGTTHPDVPVKPGVYRVTTYWSYLVIKAHKDFDEPGIEIGLTYYDDPGINIASVTTWVAMNGLSDFIGRMRKAALDYYQYKISRKERQEKDAEEIEEDATTITRVATF
ncbi:stAR-related lipid transfer protein 7, mitochondrial isoform X2 [Prorops nasuta]|uniref:stAR-related lipid transfer protein 7, mitochondrial isoform X2 n=1 Tax=Prorops nasuta TaxID=863751 RepID=UPI0034CDBDF8